MSYKEEKETKKGGREIQKKIWEEDPAAGECSGIFLCIIFWQLLRRRWAWGKAAPMLLIKMKMQFLLTLLLLYIKYSCWSTKNPGPRNFHNKTRNSWYQDWKLHIISAILILTNWTKLVKIGLYLLKLDKDGQQMDKSLIRWTKYRHKREEKKIDLIGQKIDIVR